MKQFTVPLSRLVPGKHNPRRVKPAREAHSRLVALIRSHGLLHPLVVRPCDGKQNRFMVVAGHRRLAALKEIHRSNGDPQIPCVLRKVDEATAEALSLGENFGREPMHPLDEAEAFARLATDEGKGAEAIAAEFGVGEHYVRQRMKLALLAKPIKSAYREGQIDTSIAEAFAAVPEPKQLEVWNEVDGRPHHAQHVRNIIASGWIDAELAMFDVSTLEPSVISQDLFGKKVLIERKAFMDAQAKALIARQEAMKEQGWFEVIVGNRHDLTDRLLSAEPLPLEFDPATSRKLAKIDKDRARLEKAAAKVDEHDERRLQRLSDRFEALEAKRAQVEQSAPVQFSEKTMAKGMAFLMLDPDGRVHTEYRIPRRSKSTETARNGNAAGSGADVPSEDREASADDLSDRQLATTFTHQVLLVRQALLKNEQLRRCVLAMMLHEKVSSEALSVRRDANGTTLHAGSDGFKSTAADRVMQQVAKLDPFIKKHHIDDCEAYAHLKTLSSTRLDALIDHLVVQCITAHLHRRTGLISMLAHELKVNVRDDWKPDADWLAAYQKPQLRHLTVELLGDVHAPASERKKSEMVDQLAKLFADAADGKLDDPQLAKKVNSWLPSNLRAESSTSPPS